MVMGDMDAAAIAGASTTLKLQQVQQDVQTRMLKMGMDTQTQLAEQLIQAIPQAAVVNPPHLGQNIDVKF